MPRLLRGWHQPSATTTCLLSLTTAGTLDSLGLSECRTALFLTLTGEACGLGLGLSIGNGSSLASLGLEDLGVTPSLGGGLGLVPLRIGGLADFGVELAVLQRGLAHGDLLLLGEDCLVAVCLGQWSGRIRLSAGSIRLGLDLGLLQHQRSFRDGDLLFGREPRLLSLTPSIGLSNGCDLANLGGLRTSQV